MIKALLAPYLGWIYAGLAAAAVVGGIWVYNSIYDRGYTAASAHYEQVALDQKAANDLAIEKARELLSGSIRNLILEKEKLEDDVARLNAEAAADPDAAAGGVSAGSVQRLNTVR
ncbi:hypothetical protein [Agrobacterium sp. CG674]